MGHRRLHNLFVPFIISFYLHALAMRLVCLPRAFLGLRTVAVDSSRYGSTFATASSSSSADSYTDSRLISELDSFTRAAYCHVGIERNMSPAVRGLLVDAAGTLISPSENTAAVYCRYGRPFGVNLPEAEILQRFRT